MNDDILFLAYILINLAGKRRIHRKERKETKRQENKDKATIAYMVFIYSQQRNTSGIMERVTN